MNSYKEETITLTLEDGNNVKQVTESVKKILITAPLREGDNLNKTKISTNNPLIKKCDEHDLWVEDYASSTIGSWS